MMRDESEAHGSGQAPPRALAGRRAKCVVLNRNNSRSRLVAATPVPEDSQLAVKLVDAEPDAAWRCGWPASTARARRVAR